MPDRLLNDIVTLLIPTLFLAFAWWTDRLSEVKYEKNLDRLPKWMQVWSNLLGMLSEPPKKTARWTFAGLLLIVYGVYIVTFDATPFLIRLSLAIAGLAIFSACVYYCEKKMGK